MRTIDADALKRDLIAKGFLPAIVKRAIENAPTIEAEPVKHGQWINRTKRVKGLWDYRFDCSTCGHIFWDAGIKNLNYCPACGAKMDLEVIK